MRLKPEKVEDLSRQILAELQKNPQVELLAPPDRIEHLIRRIFLEDLRREDALMDEVEQIMKEHARKIAGKNVDVQLLRRKIRDQLVRARKIVL